MTMASYIQETIIMTTFNILSTKQYAALVGQVGKSGIAFDKAVQAALVQSIYQALAYGNAGFMDRLHSALPAWAAKRAGYYARHFGGLLLISDKQRSKAKAGGKPYADNRYFEIAMSKRPQTHDDASKAAAEAAALEIVETLPDWRAWAPEKKTAGDIAKPVYFSKRFLPLVELANDDTAPWTTDTDRQSAAALKSFVGLIQAGTTLDDLREQIRAEILESMKPVATATKPASRKRIADAVSAVTADAKPEAKPEALAA